jgi:hypothetical protein
MFRNCLEILNSSVNAANFAINSWYHEQWNAALLEPPTGINSRKTTRVEYASGGKYDPLYFERRSSMAAIAP